MEACTLAPTEKPADGIDIEHNETYESQSHGASTTPPRSSSHRNELPASYYLSSRFIGTGAAVTVNLFASTGGFAMIAPILTDIDASIGPGPVVWLSLIYTMMLAVGLTLVGQLSDVFGRRYFFIGGTLLGAVGAAIASRARTIPVAIGGETLIGLSASTGYSYAFVTGELVPVKWRFVANAVVFWGSMPTAGFGSAISSAFVLYTDQQWRWAYYTLIIANVVAAALYAAFYFPPTFCQKHGDDTILHWVKNYDYIGMLLYLSGLLLFILGLSWGGNIYPWKSAGVIAPIVIGFFCLVALMVYEARASIAKPLVPVHLFKNRGFVSSAIVLSLGASVYYSQAICWPGMASAVYSRGDRMWAGWAGTLVGVGITIGEIIGGTLTGTIGKFKFQLLTAISIGTVFLACISICTPDTPKTAMALVMIAATAFGCIALPAGAICLEDQREIGTAIGITGSLRSAISTIASTIYSVVLAHRETSTLSAIVPTALVQAGLPVSDVASYMSAVAAGEGSVELLQIPGVTAGIIAQGNRAYQVAYMEAYRTVFYTSIAFGVLALTAAMFVPNFDNRMTDKVATKLNGAHEGKNVRDQMDA